jgi:predicted phage terminase large subunit-like protein
MPQQTLTAEWLTSLSASDRQAVLASLTKEDKEALRFDWRFWGRAEQQEPTPLQGGRETPWQTWLVLAGRGFGKTRMGAEWVRKVKAHHGRIALIGETAADVRDVMVEGESGILATSPPGDRPIYNPSKRQLQWSNGAIAKTYSGEDPDQLRGPQHEVGWVDEIAKYQYAQETWSNLQFGLRLGPWPRAMVTTTPRPIPILRQIIADTATYITRGSTFSNASNLAPQFLHAIQQRYAGTRLGRQEIDAEILDDHPNALWRRETLEKAYYDRTLPSDPQSILRTLGIRRVIIGVDPSGAGDDERGDSQGIIAMGEDGTGRGYVLDDGTVRKGPDGWARAVCDLYDKWDADRVVAERNYGGEMVRSTIRTANNRIPVTLVNASRGKHVRAEPIASLYEQGKVQHIRRWKDLEDQMCDFTTSGYEGDGSPDRVDALVWAATALMLPKSMLGIAKGIRY